MPWILYLDFAKQDQTEQSGSHSKGGHSGLPAAKKSSAFSAQTALEVRGLDNQALLASLHKAERFSQQIEREENGYWLELRGPRTVFEAMKELENEPRAMVLAPNKWLAKYLALALSTYPARLKLTSSWYMWRGRKLLSQGKELTVLCFSPASQNVDFYPSRVSARRAWQAWSESSVWHGSSVQGLWFLFPKNIEKLEKLGFQTLGQLINLGDDFLIRATGNPYLPAYLRGREGLPGLESNYPAQGLRFFQELRDPTNQNEEDSRCLQVVLQRLSCQLAVQLAERQQGCLRLRLTVTHEGESLSRERSFSSPQYSQWALGENVLLLYRTLDFPSYGEVCLEAEGLQPVVYPQYTLFAEQTRPAQDPRLAALASRFPGLLQRGLGLSHREKMLVHWDPWRYDLKKM